MLGDDPRRDIQRSQEQGRLGRGTSGQDMALDELA
jgi:hypothetical protein